MPLYVVDKVADALNEQSKAVRGSRVVVLGVAYKADVDDVRESPALDIIELLRKKGADVVYHDPYVPRIRLDGHELNSCDYSSQLLQDAECVVIVTNHKWYNWGEIVENSAMIVDTRNALASFKGAAHIFSL
jgi:UDP-N-acetyl-D-glucosamine dehydrogenase